MNAIVPKVVVGSNPSLQQQIHGTGNGSGADSAGISADGLPQHDTSADRLFDAQATLDRLDGSRELLGNMSALFALQWHQRLAEIVTAMQRRDATAVEMAASQLRKSLGSFGAGKASRVAQEVEELGRKRGFQDMTIKADQLRIEIERLVYALKDFASEAVPGECH